MADTWTKATVDLTPWVGQTIQVVFYYQAYPYGDEIYGWTIDDIAITGVVAGGNVSITKNLGSSIRRLRKLNLAKTGLVVLTAPRGMWCNRNAAHHPPYCHRLQP